MFEKSRIVFDIDPTAADGVVEMSLDATGAFALLTVTGNLTITQNVIFSGGTFAVSTPAVEALAASGDALTLDATFKRITCTTTGDQVVLPDGTTSGQLLFIQNVGAATVCDFDEADGADNTAIDGGGDQRGGQSTVLELDNQEILMLIWNSTHWIQMANVTGGDLD